MQLFCKVQYLGHIHFLSENLSHCSKAFPRSWDVFFSTFFFVSKHFLRITMLKTCFFWHKKTSIHIHNDWNAPGGYSLSEHNKIKNFEKCSYLTLYSSFDFSRNPLLTKIWLKIFLLFEKNSAPKNRLKNLKSWLVFLVLSKISDL